MSRHRAMSCTLVLLLAADPALALADGGTVRLAHDVGSYSVAVFSDPSPLRAGPVDISVWVRDQRTGELASEAELSVEAVHSESGRRLTASASHATATNKLFQAAQFELPSAGEWEFRVTVRNSGEHEAGEPVAVAFKATAAEPLPRWRELALWIFWPIVPIALFATRHRGRRPAH
jgi:hypothetical protein